MIPQTFIFFGRSGCGKGTQAELLIDYLAKKDPNRKTIFIETGRLLRSFADNEKGFTGQKVKKILGEGGLQPEFLPIYLWGGKLIKELSGDEHIVCDGVARRLPEAPVLDSAFHFYDRKSPNVVYLNVSSEWAIKRLLERGRSDDDKKEIENRMTWFDKNVVPAINYFKDNSYYNFSEINGEQEIEKVHADIIRAINI